MIYVILIYIDLNLNKLFYLKKNWLDSFEVTFNKFTTNGSCEGEIGITLKLT